MSQHSATVEWQRATPDFSYPTYNRAHLWRFESGVEVPGRASPANVPATAPQPAGIDPEESFIAALASCHMLWFLHIACNRKFTVDRYTDHAVGLLGKTPGGKVAITHVTLRPAVVFSGTAPTTEQLKGLHEKAHEECYIANSVLSEIAIEPQ